MARKKTLHVTDTEFAVLRVLWQNGKETARRITEEVYPNCTASDFATVHSMLKRLEAKGAVKRDRSTHPHGFAAAVTESDIAGLKLAELADQLSDGSMAPFILHLMEAQKLSQEDADAIRKMLKNYKPKGL
ncbi:BlaI/MecI/CopY family transcriptional regulator [Gimesia aquarii]|uniref:Methicillin resistance regulatory protein MecI n=2 Tax=Gimesia aquarii TaxID=2527964 RepID=A0A517W0E9_9PLAN|nr:BlaI/MecI/CopY family transcriptional regulator [Gimesia aquarii]QDT98731.1 Methicillin resistance regulatory protein MecI [Gimesia aquarii]